MKVTTGVAEIGADGEVAGYGGCRGEGCGDDVQGGAEEGGEEVGAGGGGIPVCGKLVAELLDDGRWGGHRRERGKIMKI